MRSDNYWDTCMATRMSECDEVTRLVTILYGFFARQADEDTILDFYHSKRPYGNKDVAASIAFNLGWDRERRLCTEYMPEWVEEKAMQLHEKVLAKIKEAAED